MPELIFSSSGLIATVLAIGFSLIFQLENVSSWNWLWLVVGVDVAHVYSSLYRTYLNPTQRKSLGYLLSVIPLLSFLATAALAFLSVKVFWMSLAYLAIFHFARQQIGFLRWMKIPAGGSKLILEIGVYGSTLGSVFLWHLHGPKNFHWFVSEDLIYLHRFSQIPIFTIGSPSHTLTLLALAKSILLLLFLVSWFFSWVLYFRRQVKITIPLLLLSTFVSWYLPIVVFNSDFIFSFSNILAHGLPYLTLVWSEEQRTQSLFRRWELFLPLILGFAFLEEALWDATVWQEHPLFFESFYFLPQISGDSSGSDFLRAFVMAFLILPQVTHYLLDAYIWKKKYRQPSPSLSKIRPSFAELLNEEAKIGKL